MADTALPKPEIIEVGTNLSRSRQALAALRVRSSIAED
jgi:hypothetical protein